MCTCATHCPESPHHERACCSATRCACWCHLPTSCEGCEDGIPRKRDPVTGLHYHDIKDPIGGRTFHEICAREGGDV
jgi:hypothetical protein